MVETNSAKKKNCPGPAVSAEPTWIPAPTSGILHVAGVGFARRECKPGTQLLCGWVITAEKVPASPDRTTASPRKCVRCATWLRLNAEKPEETARAR